MIQLVFAHSGSAFGAADGMPWPHISQDFKNFKARTKDTVLVMGAKTFASLPCKLPGRQHIVLYNPERSVPCAKNGDRPDCWFNISAMDECLKTMAEDKDNMFSVIGGKELLAHALPYALKVFKTTIVAPLDKPVTQTLDVEFFDAIDKMVYVNNAVYRDGLMSIIEGEYRHLNYA